MISEFDFEKLRQLRANNPEAVANVFASRKRRPLLTGDSKLFIVACDHPARGALAVGSDSLAMADRYDLLEKLAIALSRPGVDGVLGTPDIIEDLALLGLLDNKVIVGSMNRGGLRGATFEMDDRYTAYDIESLIRDQIDFGKNLVRVNFEDAGTVNTLEATAKAVNEAVAAKLPIMLEPFISEWVDGRIKNDLSTDAVIKSIAIAAGLGNSSRYTWLKLPVVPEMERVMQSTTLPTLLLGGDPNVDPGEMYQSWENALSLDGVKGLVVGRSMLYPQYGSVEDAIDTAANLVHTNK